MSDQTLVLEKFAEVKSGCDFGLLRLRMIESQIFLPEEVEPCLEAFLQIFCLHVLDEGVLPNPGGMIDEVHHLFILSDTEAYFDFCRKYFGTEIHHVHKTACPQCAITKVCSCAPKVHSLFDIYGDQLSPLLQGWVKHHEEVAKLPPEQILLLLKRDALERAMFLARKYRDQAEKILAELESP